MMKLYINKYGFVILIILGTGFISGAIFYKYGLTRIVKEITVTPCIDEINKPIAHISSSIPLEYQGKLSLFVLVGQSNMSGRGDLRRVHRKLNNKIFVFGNDYRWHLAQEPIDNPKDQVDNVSLDRSAGYSPACSFAEALLVKKPDKIIGLIPCAMGGSSIYQWQRCLSETSLYGSCLKRIYAASTMGKICGVLFFQGESDALDPKLHTEINPMPYEWSYQFKRLISDFRNDLSRPTLPVVFAQIGRNNNAKMFINWDTVKSQQQSINIPYCKMIITDDLELRDKVHFTCESYDVIGKRFAESILSIIEWE